MKRTKNALHLNYFLAYLWLAASKLLFGLAAICRLLSGGRGVCRFCLSHLGQAGSLIGRAIGRAILRLLTRIGRSIALAFSRLVLALFQRVRQAVGRCEGMAGNAWQFRQELLIEMKD